MTPFGAGSGTTTHKPVCTSSALPGRQNGAQALAPAVSPGRQAELTAGEKTMIPAVGAAASAAADNAPAVSRRAEYVMVAHFKRPGCCGEAFAGVPVKGSAWPRRLESDPLERLVELFGGDFVALALGQRALVDG